MATQEDASNQTFGFEHRGVVEGHYGRIYSHQERLWLIERLAEWGMNRYIYAPKNEPLGRAEWRTPYEREELQSFAELTAVGENAGYRSASLSRPGSPSNTHLARTSKS